MYRGSHDSWERLVEAVMRREQLRKTALADSWSLSTIPNSHYSLSSSLPGVEMVEYTRKNGDHKPYTEPKMKAARTRIKQQINQVTAYFKNITLRNKEQSVFYDKKIVFLEGCNLAFDLCDLLSAPGEILGEGTFGCTFGAQLKNGQKIVVKRLTEVSFSLVSFEQQMNLLGNIKHENVDTPRGFCLSNADSIILYDYYRQRSVYDMLHGTSRGNIVSLEWENRLRIAIGTARGIAHIHTQCGGELIHGNIKASNIFLNSQEYGCISGLGLGKLISPMAPPFMWIAGYAAPEVMEAGKVSQASDVYSLGVLLLELLTGISPINYRGDCEYEVDNFVRWVHCLVVSKEGLEGEVFDAKIFNYLNIGELVHILELGMSCVARIPEHRPKMSDVVKMLENAKEHNDGREIKRSRFHFDFEFERILLPEAIKESPNWSRLGLETIPESTSYNPSADHLVSKYIASGLNRDAVPIAVVNYGDNPAKVKEFVKGYTLLREMGFSSNSVADALFMYDNDTDKALAHFLNGAS